VGAIALNHHGAEINGDCRGCGICLKACPYNAIQLEVDGKTDLLVDFIARVQGYSDISSSGKALS